MISLVTKEIIKMSPNQKYMVKRVIIEDIRRVIMKDLRCRH